MQLGKVIGHATSTIKHPSLEGWRLLVVQPLNNARQPEADVIVAISGLNAAVGQTVVFNADGKGARDLIKHDKSPVRYFVCAIESESTSPAVAGRSAS
jgi:ethanolamine utilization protein EutN